MYCVLWPSQWDIWIIVALKELDVILKDGEMEKLCLMMNKSAYLWIFR